MTNGRIQFANSGKIMSCHSRMGLFQNSNISNLQAYICKLNQAKKNTADRRNKREKELERDNKRNIYCKFPYMVLINCFNKTRGGFNKICQKPLKLIQSRGTFIT